MKTLHLRPARAKPASRLLVNSVLPTPGNPVMCIGMRACRPIAMSCTKCLKSMIARTGLDTRFGEVARIRDRHHVAQAFRPALQIRLVRLKPDQSLDQPSLARL